MKNLTKKLLHFALVVVLIAESLFLGFGVDTVITAQAAVMSTTRASVHDPSIVKANGKYYIFGTHMSNAVSSDLTNWSTFTTNVNTDYSSIFSVGAGWASRGSSSYDLSTNLWAPDVIYNKDMGKWCMYMSVNGANWYSSIALATADSIEGPYTYQGTIVYSGFTNSTEAAATDYSKVMGTNTVAGRYLSSGSWNSSYGPNAIDPCVLYDANGELWMSYGSWFGGIYMLKLDNETGLRDYSYTYSTQTNVSDQYFGTKISGGYGCTGEGSYIVYDKEAGYYYLYMSYCGLDATDSFSGYHMRLFRSKNITGPYTDSMGNTAICTSAGADQSTKGVKLMGNYYLSSLADVAGTEISSAGYMSPGHNSAFIDDDGQRYVVYHTRFNNGTEWHQVRVHQQFLNQDGWLVTAPYEYLGSDISSTGYSTSDIVGTYDFVNHGTSATTAYTGMLDTDTVSLNSDGTISGDYTGTWTAVQGTYYCTMVIGGTTYKGVFFKQYDESASHNEVMTFSLIGNNDQAVFGSKVSSDEYAAGSSGTSAAALDGIYFIKSKLSGKYLDIVNGSSADGTNIQQYGFNGSHAQTFKLVSDGNGYYYILTGSSNYTSCIDITDGSSADGANVIQWTYWGGDCQKFQIVEVDGAYAIKTKCSGSSSALDVYGMSTEDGANICQWTYWGGDGQLWYLESAATDLDGKTFYVKSELSGKYLDIVAGSSADGTNIQQFAFNGSHAQKFKFVADGEGYYSILTGSSGYNSCLDVTNGSSEDGANIIQWTYWGGECQKFMVVEVQDGVYAIKSKCSGTDSALDVYGMSTEDGANICQWTYWGGAGQLWSLEETTEEDTLDGTYYIQSKLSGKYLDIVNGSSADGTNIQQFSFNGSHAQTFKLVSDGNGYYSILTGSSNYTSCIDITDGSSADGANVIEWTYWGGDCQKFEIVEVDGYYAIKTKCSGSASALDVYGMSTEDGANICQWTYWGGDGQLWSLVPVS